MSAVLSGLENIQCRVAYLSGPSDPQSTQPHGREMGPRLTPHSCNMHNRCLRIASDLVIAGYGMAPTPHQMRKSSFRFRRPASLVGVWNREGEGGRTSSSSALMESGPLPGAHEHGHHRFSWEAAAEAMSEIPPHNGRQHELLGMLPLPEALSDR